MSKKLKQALARKIISITDENIDDEAVIHTLLESEIYTLDDKVPTFGERAADNLARFAGSWLFILSFSGILALWIIINIYFITPAFDPYPFILLNLVLSCLAAIQAPLIMMSQNRQEGKDRKRAESDYRINLKSEIIIEDIHYKLDKIIDQQTYILSQIDKNETIIEKP